jgi:hypothetical protein
MASLRCWEITVVRLKTLSFLASRNCRLIALLGLISAFSGTVFSQEDEPVTRLAPVDSTIYTDRTPIEGYRSNSLRGSFRAQWMYIIQGGKRTTFWGARVLRLDADSPLRTLGLMQGDVITRLDGLPIWRGMYKEDGREWQVIELDNHFGHTEVRYIVQGTHQVRVGQINIDTSIDDGAPLPP